MHAAITRMTTNVRGLSAGARDAARETVGAGERRLQLESPAGKKTVLDARLHITGEVAGREHAVARVFGLDVEVAQEDTGHLARKVVQALCHQRHVHRHGVMVPEHARHVVPVAPNRPRM
jgi:hypothetical protein